MTSATSAGNVLSALAAALLGGAVVIWAGGPRLIDPREIGWVMRGDWQTHFLGWHFFRNEPWHWPPGLITGMLEPVGTSLGYTDSIPLAAFVMKPFAEWLPNPFQYLGLWLLVCFALQAFFGALLASTWTPRRSLQLLAAMLFVFLPPLAGRIAHPALCAHWLLLWALWLYWREPTTRVRDHVQHGALGLVSGLVHPYLAVMVLALLLALLGRRLVAGRSTAMSAALAAFALASGGVAAGWWASGLMTLPSASDMTASSGTFSMNVLAIVNPGALPSEFLPGFPVVSAAQLGEGYQYLGFGVLMLWVVAAALVILKRPAVRSSLPLLAVLMLCAVYSMLPVVAIGRDVILDLSDLDLFSLFRSTGRFFWPVTYALTAAAAGAVAVTFSTGVAAALLGSALVLQLVDLQQWWLDMHRGSRSEAFFAWDMPLRSSIWGDILPNYRRIRLYFPSYCGHDLPVPGPAPAFLAGRYGLTLNDGFAARLDARKHARACEDLQRDLGSGSIDDETVYLVGPAARSELQARLGTAVECRDIDGVGVCVSSRSISRRTLGQ
jgi:hypothetical protein